MTNQIERLPRLIEQATSTLAKAMNAAEVLDAADQANVAYTAAKMAVRMTRIRDAHDTVLAACRKTMADALVIEGRAQCRLADEYDAAQERGEVQKVGGDRKSINIPNKNNDPKVGDIGLTSKQVHEARAMRDAENAKPGIVRKTVDDKLAAGEEPSRADVKRAVKNTKSNGTRPARSVRSSKARQREEKVAILADAGMSTAEIAAETGIHPRNVNQALEHVAIKREAEAQIDPATLSVSAQQKLATAIKQHQHKLSAQFHARVQEEIRKRLEETVLPHYRKEQAEAQRIIKARKGVMDKATFNRIRRCLHPDSRQSVSDKILAEAFDAFMALEKLLLDEKNSPTEFTPLPSTYEAWEQMKRNATAARRAKRATSQSAIRPR